ncbi:MAG: GntR family transcriptional regulator [Candidatus Saccharibacteria bacterium]|nr:GntR family transcriptional regulator [Microbacteriaceae bacterium]
MKGLRPLVTKSEVRESASSLAYRTLRRMILHGELHEGARINEVEMATLIGVSRTPVREALRELLNEHVLAEGPSRQVVVGTASSAKLQELMLIRPALERLSVQEAATNADISALDQLRLISIRARRASQAGDIAEYFDLDDEFHLQLARAAGLPLVEDTLRRLSGYARLAGLTRTWTVEELGGNVDRQETITDLLERGETAGAGKAVEEKILHLLKLIIQSVEFDT